MYTGRLHVRIHVCMMHESNTSDLIDKATYIQLARVSSFSNSPGWDSIPQPSISVTGVSYMYMCICICI